MSFLLRFLKYFFDFFSALFPAPKIRVVQLGSAADGKTMVTKIIIRIVG